MAPFLFELCTAALTFLFSWSLPEILAPYWPRRIHNQTTFPVAVPVAGFIFGPSLILAPISVVLSLVVALTLAADSKVRRYFVGALTLPALIYALMFLAAESRLVSDAMRESELGFKLINIMVVAALPLFYGACFVRADVNCVAKWRAVTMAIVMLISALLLVVFSIAIYFMAGVG